MTSAEIKLAHELHGEGYSLRELAKELNVPKSTVERALKTPLADEDELDEDDEDEIDRDEDDENEEDEDDDEVEDDEPSEEELPRPAAPVRPLKASRALVSTRQATTALAPQVTQALMLELATQREARRAERQRIQSRKEWFVGKTNRLIRELIKNADKTTWDEEEVDDFILRVDTLKEKLGKFCEKHAIDEEGLQIWAVLIELENFMKAHMEENRPWLGSEVTFELSKEAIRSWKDNMVDSFEDEAYEEEEDDEADEDEDDD